MPPPPLRILPSLKDSRKIISLCLDKKTLTWKARNNNKAARRQIPGYERLYGTLKETGLLKYFISNHGVIIIGMGSQHQE
ncbi:hypothetical protein CEXT_134801 [Caerostris extrusa]|uniref:Ribosomal protein S8 n=1 Tax=Caerostris extrusa TaxID=172846 RepID=A0AAV4T2J9_CAEEX|nr:hypothetical protein CEXT_134801 [Caerostris extrusa]